MSDENIINLRIKIAPGANGIDVMHLIGNNVVDVLEITPLYNKGFGHLSYDPAMTVSYEDDSIHEEAQVTPPAFQPRT